MKLAESDLSKKREDLLLQFRDLIRYGFKGGLLKIILDLDAIEMIGRGTNKRGGVCAVD
jgi:hypothetical protein